MVSPACEAGSRSWPVALLIELPVSQDHLPGPRNNGGPGVDIFANGKLISPRARTGMTLQHYQPISRLYELESVPASETSLTLVIRTPYIPFGLTSYTSFFSNRTFRLGNP